MEIRQSTEYKIWILELANMHGQVDKARCIAIFDEYQKLKDWYNSQLSEQPYKDKGYNSYTGNNDYEYHKVFKKGSPLEWYNPCSTLEEQNYQDRSFGGVGSQWVDWYPSRENINPSYLFNPL